MGISKAMAMNVLSAIILTLCLSPTSGIASQYGSDPSQWAAQARAQAGSTIEHHMNPQEQEVVLLDAPSEGEEVALVDASLGRELKDEQKEVPRETTALRRGAHKLEELSEQTASVLRTTRTAAKTASRLERRAAHSDPGNAIQMANDAKLADAEQAEVLKRSKKLTLHAAAVTAELSMQHNEAWSQVGAAAEVQGQGQAFKILRESNDKLQRISNLSGEAAAAAKRIEVAARTAVQEQREAKVLSNEQAQTGVAPSVKQIQQLAAATQGHEDTAAANLAKARRNAALVADQIEHMSV